MGTNFFEKNYIKKIYGDGWFTSLFWTKFAPHKNNHLYRWYELRIMYRTTCVHMLLCISISLASS